MGAAGAAGLVDKAHRHMIAGHPADLRHAPGGSQRLAIVPGHRQSMAMVMARRWPLRIGALYGPQPLRGPLVVEISYKTHPGISGIVRV